MNHHLRIAWLQPLTAVLLIGGLTAVLVAARWHLRLPQVDLVVSSLALGASAAGAVAGYATLTSPPPDQDATAARTVWTLRLLPLGLLLIVAFLALIPTAARAGAESILLRQLVVCTGLALTASRLAGRPGVALPVLWAMSVIVAGRDGTEVAALWRPLYATTTTPHLTALALALLVAGVAGASTDASLGHLLARIRHHAQPAHLRNDVRG